MSSERLTIRLPLDLQAGLGSLVVETGRTESELVREAIAEYVRRHARRPTSYDLAKKAGIIGCVDTGETDLSTNPRHMEGFGRD